jgi:methanethiol oxidase
MHHSHEGHHQNHASCGPGYPSPKEAMEKAERERVLYTMALYVGTGVEEPDYLATVDVGTELSTYSQVVHRTPMPNVGDELHHFGWNACRSCHGDETLGRSPLAGRGRTRCASRGATSPRTTRSGADDPFEGKPLGSW